MINPDRIFQACIIGIYILILGTSSINLTQEYLWFDESVQFWVAKGLNPDSDPYSIPGGIASVVENNKYYNMDPGGFSILLHFWSGISNSEEWLRLLPFLFYIGVLLTFIYLSFAWLNNFNVALMVGFIPMLYPMLLNMGFEIRAFTMEALGTMLCVISLEYFSKRINFRSLFLFGLAFSIFLTSRYSSIFVIYITSLLIVLFILKQRSDSKSKLLSMLIFGVPILIATAFVYFSAFKYQNPGASQVSYIQYLQDTPQLILKPQALLYLGSIGVLVFIYWKRNKYLIIKKYENLLLLTLIINFLFLLLSLLGKYPWLPPFTFRANRCISMILLTMLCYSSIAGELLLPLFKSKDVIKYYVALLTLVFVVSLSLNTIFIRFYKWGYDVKIRESESNKYVTSNLYLDLINTKLDDSKNILVYVGETPYIKYLYEYGALASKAKEYYPSRFTLTKSGRHTAFKGASGAELFGSRAINPQIRDYSYYDLIISDNIPEEKKWLLKQGTTNLWVKETLE